jgi:CRP/FNR family transcriptional regulator
MLAKDPGTIFKTKRLEGFHAWLKALPCACSSWLQNRSKLISFSAGSLIVKEKDTNSSVFVLNKGILKLTKTFSGGHEQILHFAAPGEVFGLHSLDGPAIWPYTLSAQVSCEVAELQLRDLQEAIRREPSLILFLLQKIDQHINELDRHRALLLSGLSRQSIFQIVLTLKKRFGTDEYGRIALPLRAVDLANYLGMSRTHLYYVLSQMPERLEYRRGFLKILSTD